MLKAVKRWATDPAGRPVPVRVLLQRGARREQLRVVLPQARLTAAPELAGVQRAGRHPIAEADDHLVQRVDLADAEERTPSGCRPASGRLTGAPHGASISGAGRRAPIARSPRGGRSSSAPASPAPTRWCAPGSRSADRRVLAGRSGPDMPLQLPCKSPSGVSDHRWIRDPRPCAALLRQRVRRSSAVLTRGRSAGPRSVRWGGDPRAAITAQGTDPRRLLPACAGRLRRKYRPRSARAGSLAFRLAQGRAGGREDITPPAAR